MSQPTRRNFLKYLGAGAVGVGAASAAGYYLLSRGSGNPSTTTTSSTSTYKPPANATSDYAEFMTWLASVSGPYSGQSLDVSLEIEFQPLGLQRIDPDFFTATGINNRYDLKTYSLHLADISQLSSTHSPDYDILSLDIQDIGSYPDLVIPPDELADMYPDITYEKINPQDFQSLAWSLCGTYPPDIYQGTTTTTSATNGNVYVPLDMSTMIQYYRKDLFDAAGIAPAATWDEYVAAAKSLTGSSARFGTVNEASLQIPVVYEYLNFLPSYGGSLWNYSNGELTSGMDSSAALNALETYASLYAYADPASLTYSWDNISTDLLRNVGAMAIQFQGYESYAEDPLRSQVIGKMDYAPVPAGPSGSYPLYGGSGVGVSRYSKNPQMAWLWLQWATSLGAQETTVLDYYHPFPSRTAVFNNSTIKQALGTSAFRAINVAKQSWDAGKLAVLTPFPKWLDVLDPISFYLNEGYRGATTPQDALNQMMQKILSWGSLTF